LFGPELLYDSFQFLDPGPLIDGELELIAPQPRWIEEVQYSCAHPLTRVQAPQEALTSRQQIEQFLESAPGGRESPQSAADNIPQQHFWMRLRESHVGAIGSPPIRMLGGISLRIGTNDSIRLYYGNIGYHVYPPARGRRYAERACRLLLPLARLYGLHSLWITCNPDNFASRTTCERLGAKMVDVVAVPASDPLYARGEHFKCRYCLEK
jgi:predicted acetyltransferase